MRTGKMDLANAGVLFVVEDESYAKEFEQIEREKKEHVSTSEEGLMFIGRVMDLLVAQEYGLVAKAAAEYFSKDDAETVLKSNTWRYFTHLAVTPRGITVSSITDTHGDKRFIIGYGREQYVTDYKKPVVKEEKKEELPEENVCSDAPQVKIFKSSDPDELAAEINQFISMIGDTLVDIQYGVSSTGATTVFSAMVVYSK